MKFIKRIMVKTKYSYQIYNYVLMHFRIIEIGLFSISDATLNAASRKIYNDTHVMSSIKEALAMMVFYLNCALHEGGFIF